MNIKPKHVSAIVLAGGRDDLSRERGVASKALVLIEGQPMAYHILRALEGSASVNFTSYVGQSDPSFLHLTNAVLPAGETMAATLALGAGAALAAHPQQPLLILSADVPWLTPHAIDTLVQNTPDVDLVYPIIPKNISEQQFPGQKRTYIKIAEGHFTGGNVIIVSVKMLPKLLKVLDLLYNARKNPIGLAKLFGVDIIIRLLLGRVTIAEVEGRAKKLLDAELKAWISHDASLGADVDKASHLQGIVLPNF
ncbi:MAG: NTP transferase domain-containing protein [Trueperaceae bacterium]